MDFLFAAQFITLLGGVVLWAHVLRRWEDIDDGLYRAQQ
jgi:hypothetical protein